MAATTTRKGLITAEEFWLLAHREGRRELVNGRVVEMPPVGPLHGDVDANLVLALKTFLRDNRLGRVYINTGFLLHRKPDLVRAPDEAFVAAQRIRANPPPERGFWDIVPDLAVDIVSPDDTAEDVHEKVLDYLNAGVRLLWVVYPRHRQVQVYRPGESVRLLYGDDVLTGKPLMPGFEVPLGQLWD